MRAVNGGRPWEMRARACAGAITALVVALGVISGVESSEGSLALPKAFLSEFGFACEASSPFPTTEGASLPEGFEVVLPELPEHDDLRVDSELGLVGYYVAEGCEQAFSTLDGMLSANGWSRIDSGLSCASSYVKEDLGVFISCTAVGTGSSVVVQAPFLAVVSDPSFDGGE